MDSPVLNLQKDAMNSMVPLNDLLRKAFVIARKLKIKEFEDWIQYELNGYEDADKIPNYRKVTGTIKAWNPYNGWIPVIIQDESFAKTLRTRPVKQSVSDLHALFEKQSEKGFLLIHYPPEIENGLMQDSMCQPALHVGANSIKGILDCVRNTVLEWALKLEEEGILGEGLSFSYDEKEKAQNSQNITIQNFQGILGDVSDSTVTQSLNMNIKQGDFEGLAGFLKSKGIDEKDISALKKAVTDDPKPVSSKSFGEKVGGWIGNMISKAATGAWDISVQVAGTILTKAISMYYGLPS